MTSLFLKKRIKEIVGGLTLLFLLSEAKSQDNFTGIMPSEQINRIVFYNVENLFDTDDDPLTNDDEFLPYGPKGWNMGKFKAKINNIAKTLIAVGEWTPPIIVGLCEIENLQVLQALTEQTPLYRLNYKVIHEESIDSRGIDVALLYREGYFFPIAHQQFRITFPEQPDKTTRDILYVKGTLPSEDTLHLFVNHWPSRFGGKLSSEAYRIQAARLLKLKVDSLLTHIPEANIIMMGDFNDEPHNTSITENLQVTDYNGSIEPNHLYGLISKKSMNKPLAQGTLKYQGNWFIFDQIIVSSALLTNNHLLINDKVAGVFSAEWLLEEDATYLGHKPKRTYAGYRYLGGYSDHLPVYVDLKLPSTLD